MLKAFVSGGDYSPASNELDLKIRIIKPESKEENEYGDFIKIYAFPTKSSEIPLLEVSIIKKGTRKRALKVEPIEGIEYIYFKLGYDADKLTKEGVIAIINEWGGIKPELLSLEEITTKKETKSENLKALRKVAIDYDWILSDATEVLVEIYSQGFSYPESINILKEVLHTVNQDSQLDWKQELPKIIERWKNSIQEYERRKSFEKALHQGLLKTITISVEGVNPSIKILNPQPASAKNNNMGDADYAIELLEEWDDETAFALRGNMKII